MKLIFKDLMKQTKKKGFIVTNPYDVVKSAHDIRRKLAAEIRYEWT